MNLNSMNETPMASRMAIGLFGKRNAGKSSLIKALSGAVVPDEGEITLEGQKINFTSPIDAESSRPSGEMSRS